MVKCRGRGGGINFLALEKPTYQILSSYDAKNPLKSLCGGGGWLKVILVLGFGLGQANHNAK